MPVAITVVKVLVFDYVIVFFLCMLNETMLCTVYAGRRGWRMMKFSSRRFPRPKKQRRNYLSEDIENLE